MPLFKDKLDVLKGLILFCKEQGIPHFKYQDFIFDLSAPNPNEAKLEALTQEFMKLKAIVNSLSLKEEFKQPSVFNRAEALAMKMSK